MKIVKFYRNFWQNTILHNFKNLKRRSRFYKFKTQNLSKKLRNLWRISRTSSLRTNSWKNNSSSVHNHSKFISRSSPNIKTVFITCSRNSPKFYTNSKHNSNNNTKDKYRTTKFNKQNMQIELSHLRKYFRTRKKNSKKSLNSLKNKPIKFNPYKKYADKKKFRQKTKSIEDGRLNNTWSIEKDNLRQSLKTLRKITLNWNT